MAVLVEAFQQELTKLGWIEGKNITIEYRFAEQKPERAPELAADLVRLKVDLIVTTGGPQVSAVKKATATIPIVMTNSADPVSEGLVDSLAQPGGNVTGLSGLSPELITKRLEVLKDAVPKLSRVGLLRPAAASERQPKEARAAALALKLKLEEIETQRDAKGLETAFQTASRSRWARLSRLPLPPSLPKESGSSTLPLNTACLLFIHRGSLSMRVDSCLTGRSGSISTGVRPTTSTRS